MYCRCNCVFLSIDILKSFKSLKIIIKEVINGNIERFYVLIGRVDYDYYC